MTYTENDSWSLKNPTQVHFGVQVPAQLPAYLLRVPTLFVTSPGFVKRGLAKSVTEILEASQIPYQLLGVATANPSFEDLAEVSNTLAGYQPQQILAIGGGSVIDLAKILSYTLASGAPAYASVLELLKKGDALPVVSPIPLIAVPTTSGTGAEVTPFATVWDMQAKKKYSIATTNLHPQKALLDPSLTLTLPWDVTIATGMDAISQALESVWNKNHTPQTGALAARALQLGFEALPILSRDLGNLAARTKLAEASLLAGLCISRTRTAMAHSASYPLTAHFGVPHGIACSFTLPDLWTANFGCDDGRMKNLLADLGFGETFDLENHLAKFMESINFRKTFQSYRLSWQSVAPLVGEMFTPGRANNNLCDFSSRETLNAFVKKSLLRWE